MNDKTKVLYVDDEFLNLSSFEILFKNKFTVFIASNGIKGLEIFENNNINIVISDQKMPQMTGIEFLEKVYEKNNNTLRIIHSGFIDSCEIQNAIENNIAQFCLDKPLQEYLLLDIINNYLKK